MKSIVLSLLFFMLMAVAFAQNPVAQSTQTEFSVGFSTASLLSGQELMRAHNLRAQGLSYYALPNGTRRNVGAYPALSGITLKIGFYKPIRAGHGWMWGLQVRNSMLGSQPETGGYEEGYFFNFLSGAVALKYYPFEKNNLYFNAEIGQAAVFTKNRYVTETGGQNYFHQFGIGFSGGVSAGYSLTPFKNKNRLIDVQAHYQWANTRVEVNGLGDDAWQFGSLHFTVGISF